MTFLAFVAAVTLAIVALVQARGLRSRIEDIERRLRAQIVTETTQKECAELSPESPHTEVVPGRRPNSFMDAEYVRPRTFIDETGVSSISHEDPLVRLWLWCKEDWLMKLGGLLVVLGMGWFVSYAIAEGWIGPYGRIMLGCTVGAGVLGLGYYRLQKVAIQGSTLMVVGAAIVLLTLFAARELYDMFTPLSVLIVMFGTTCLLGAASIRYVRRELAYANVALAAIVPLFSGWPDPTVFEVMLYLLVLSAGTVWVAVLTSWRELTLASLAVVWLYSVNVLQGYRFRDELDLGMLFAFILVSLFFTASTVGMRMASRLSIVDVLLGLGSGVFLLMWIINGASDEWQSMLCAVWMVVFAVGAFLATRLGAPVGYFYTYAGVGVVLLGVATALELEGPALAVAAIVEAALVLWFGYRITGTARNIPVLCIPSVIPVLLSFSSMAARAWQDDIFHEDAFVLVMMVLTTAGVGALFRERVRHVRKEDQGVMYATATVLFSVSAIYTAILIWLGAGALFGPDSGVMVALIVYTFVAALLFIVSHDSGVRWQRVGAIALTAFVVGRLLLVDVWDMDLGPRVVTFLVTGVVLMFVAWLERRSLLRKSTSTEDATF